MSNAIITPRVGECYRLRFTANDNPQRYIVIRVDDQSVTYQCWNGTRSTTGLADFFEWFEPDRGVAQLDRIDGDE